MHGTLATWRANDRAAAHVDALRSWTRHDQSLSPSHADAVMDRFARVQRQCIRTFADRVYLMTQTAALYRRTQQLCVSLDQLQLCARNRRPPVAPFIGAGEARSVRALPRPAGSAAFRPSKSVGKPGKLRSGLPAARLRRVAAYVEAHLGNRISVRKLADVAGMSPSHFSALFKHSVGMAPHRFVLERRLARARQMLAANELSVMAVGYTLGFSSHAHFTTTFRSWTGITPTGFRHQANNCDCE